MLQPCLFILPSRPKASNSLPPIRVHPHRKKKRAGSLYKPRTDDLDARSEYMGAGMLTTKIIKDTWKLVMSAREKYAWTGLRVDLKC